MRGMLYLSLSDLKNRDHRQRETDVSRCPLPRTTARTSVLSPAAEEPLKEPFSAPEMPALIRKESQQLKNTGLLPGKRKWRKVTAAL